MSLVQVSPDDHVTFRITFDSYTYLVEDDLYILSYLYSLKTAFFCRIWR